MDSLPNFIVGYLGDTSSMLTLEEVHRAAVKAIRASSSSSTSTHTTPSNSSVNTSLHAAHTVSRSHPSTSIDQRYERAQRRGGFCFHCGAAGHFMYECELKKSGKPQVAAGARVYAAWAARSGVQQPYDPARVSAQLGYPGGDNNNSNNNNSSAAAAGSASSSNTSSASSSSHHNRNRSRSRSRGRRLDRHANDNEAVSVSDSDSVTHHSSSSSVVAHEDMDSITDAIVAAIGAGPCSSTLCAKTAIHGVDVGYSMVDSGCNRMIMRNTALDKYNLRNKIRMRKISNHSIASATGHQIPIIGRFHTYVHVNDTPYCARAPVYVIDNKPSADINCDVVLGRAVLARSKYCLIDTKDGTLCSKDGSVAPLTCSPAMRTVDDSGRQCLAPSTTSSLTISAMESRVAPRVSVPRGQDPRTIHAPPTSISTPAQKTRFI